jgi:hypothetical protein
MRAAIQIRQAQLEAAVCDEFQLPRELLKTTDNILQFLLAKLDYVPSALFMEDDSEQPALNHNPRAAAKWLQALDPDDADADAAGPSDEVLCG